MRSLFTKIAIFALCTTVLLPTLGCGYSNPLKDAEKTRENKREWDQHGDDPNWEPGQKTKQTDDQ